MPSKKKKSKPQIIKNTDAKITPTYTPTEKHLQVCLALSLAQIATNLGHEERRFDICVLNSIQPLYQNLALPIVALNGQNKRQNTEI